jgi:hypothetical protein
LSYLPLVAVEATTLKIWRRDDCLNGLSILLRPPFSTELSPEAGQNLGDFQILFDTCLGQLLLVEALLRCKGGDHCEPLSRRCRSHSGISPLLIQILVISIILLILLGSLKTLTL